MQFAKQAWTDNFSDGIKKPAELDSFDGFVIAGGFAYEDRGRSGVIASMDPIMTEILVQAAKGKPVLGICNGAQVLVETGLIPGSPGNPLLMSLARNKRVKMVNFSAQVFTMKMFT